MTRTLKTNYMEMIVGGFYDYKYELESDNTYDIIYRENNFLNANDVDWWQIKISSKGVGF